MADRLQEDSTTRLEEDGATTRIEEDGSSSFADIDAAIEANATVEATLSLSTDVVVEEVTRGGYLPPEEVKKQQQRRKEQERKTREDRETRDQEKREQVRELEKTFNKINGIEEVKEELEAIVKPFVEKVPKSAQGLERQPQLPSVDFQALSAQSKSVEKLTELSARIEQQRFDDDAIALLLLVA